MLRVYITRYRWREVRDLAAAKAAVLAVTEKIGAEEWYGPTCPTLSGCVFDERGTIIARVSYNGQVTAEPIYEGIAS